MEEWKERATLVRSSGGGRRGPSASVQSNQWVLEYKPLVIHSGWLIKRGHSIRNFKRRLFCIIDNQLVYHDNHNSDEVRGRIDLTKKSSIQCMLHSGFKFIQGSYEMILYAIDANDRDVWIKKLQECGVELLPPSAQTTRLAEKQNNCEKDRIIFAGWLRKRGQMVKSTKRRWFELTNSTLFYYSHPQGGSKKGSIDIVKANISNLDTLKTGERHSFVVRTQARDLILHADSEEERSLWVAYLSSVAEPTSENSLNIANAPDLHHLNRICTCTTSEQVIVDGFCRRCMSTFISKSEEALQDITREVQLIVASPYSPEGSTSAAFLRECSGRVLPLDTVRQFMSGLADYMVHTRMNELRNLGGNSLDEEFSEKILVVIHEQVEERVLYPLYRMIYEGIMQKMRSESKLMKGKIEVLRSKPQNFFGINPDCISSSGWATASAKLSDVDKVSLPYMKRAKLVVACKEIYNVYHAEHPDKPPMNADDFIPAFIYVLIHAKLEDPVCFKELVSTFDLGSNQGETAYFVTCLEIALEYIRSLLIACTVVLDATRKLGIEFTKDYERNVVIVHNLIPQGQAATSEVVHRGDVLVAVNGVPVHEMELVEITKLVKGIEGDVELCFLSLQEFEMKFRSQMIS
jgi:hypothetical protein